MPDDAVFDHAVFDHVALALPDRQPFWDLFAGDLGGRWAGGGETLGGFAFGQLRYANGMKVEALEPLAACRGFLTRFLATSGPAPHHLTFVVPDFDAAIAGARAAGYEPLGVSTGDPRWKEAFIHPRQASGIVVQLAWASGELDDEAPPWLAKSKVSEPAELALVTHAVASLDAALHLFKGALGGRTVDAGAGGGLGFVDLAWLGGTDARGGRLRLVAGDPVAAWIGARPGRIHSLGFRLADPGAVTGAIWHDGWWEVAPEPQLGVRLVLVDAAGESESPIPVAACR